MIVGQKKVILSEHSKKRLRERRQDGVTEWDVYAACQKASLLTSNRIPNPLKLKGFHSKDGTRFDMVVVDCEAGLKICTVIGFKYYRKGRFQSNSKFRRKV